jgi:cytosine/adenosine deaminase-related metal-dependent hydrolase
MRRCTVEVTWHIDGSGASVTLIRRDDDRLVSMHTRESKPAEELVVQAMRTWAESYGQQGTLPFP